MGKRRYSKELIKVILEYTENNSCSAAERKYGAGPALVYRWKNPIFNKKQNEHARKYMEDKFTDPIFKANFLNKQRERYKSDPIFKEKRKRAVSECMKWGRQNDPKYRETYMKWLRKRRALKLLVKENYTADDEKYTRILFNHKCAICGNIEKLQIDHWYPISKGFPLTRENAVLMCQAYNLNKGSKMPIECYDVSLIENISKLIHKIPYQLQSHKEI